ncbi:hypothetical protein N9H60_02940 [Flavimaricola sp.]|nr:hypothetical protein [Flavimaricola sp.]MDA9020115.1 hypothetical protein [Flavimaricola sp.]
MKSYLIGAIISIIPMATLSETHVLTFWSELVAPDYLDLGNEGYLVGDMFTRHGLKLDRPNGAVLGEYFSQARFIHIDAEETWSVRSYMIEVTLADGPIYMMDLVEFDHGLPQDAGHRHSGAVIGGSGAYGGIRGSYGLMMQEGVAVKTITYTLPED